jgi:ribonuclease BN (tRNA processing enzyme)
MRLTVLGSNGTYPTPGRPASGYLVRSATTTVLLDCGPGVFPELLRLGVMPDAVVLSHRHADHCLDVLPLFNHVRFDRPDVRGLPLLAPRGVYGRLAEFAGAGPGHVFHEVFEHRAIDPGDEVVVGDLQLGFGAVEHPVPAVCVSVSDGGSRLVYSGDTGPGGDLERVSRGADLLLCEATLQGEPDEGRYPYHLHAEEGGRIATAAGVARLVVTHLAPTLDPDRSVAEAEAFFAGPIQHAVPGLEIDL